MTPAGGGGDAPPRLLPMLAGGEGVPPDPAAYHFEPKLDGQRVLAAVAGGTVTLTNRRGADITGTYPELGGLAAALAPHQAVLDGEVVAFDAGGRTSFERLQRRMHVARPGAALLAGTPAAFVAFDVMWLDGRLLVERSQAERRLVLDGLALRGPAWQRVPVLDATPDELMAACRRLGLEGLMAKRLDAAYLPGRRSSAWRKIKLGRRRDFVVGGWAAGRGRRVGVGSLALGCHDGGRPARLYYVGQAGSGLSDDMVAQLRGVFARIGRATPPFANPPAAPLHWVEPLLVAEVAYREVTRAGTLRQPAVKGLRTDVPAADVTWDDELRAALAP